MKQWIKRILPATIRPRLRKGERLVRHQAYRTGLRALKYAPDGLEDLGTLLVECKEFTPETVILGYTQGYFLAPEHSGPLRWHDPDLRGVLPLEDFHIPRSLRSALSQGRFEIRFDADFAGVLAGCAEPVPGRQGTWLTPRLQDILVALHHLGAAHSAEAYQDGRLVGGVFGAALNGYFSGSSMFHRVDDAGKVALVYLVEILRRNHFALFDTWWIAPNLQKFGLVAVPRDEFKIQQARALLVPAAFCIPDEPFEVDHRNYK